jgi:cell wall-associated NlpC family hydrolase
VGSAVVPLTMLAGGAALVWVGIANPAGGAFAGLGNLIRGVPNDRATTNPAGFANTAADLSTVGGFLAASAGAPVNVGTAAATVSGRRAQVLQEASTWLGVPYLFGGNTRHGIDCSGFTLQVFATVGVHLPRVSYLQAKRGKRVSAAKAQPGDLVCFGAPVDHVGIYLGNGQMINAPHTGAVVRTEPVDYGAHPIQYRNVLGNPKPRKGRTQR